MSPAKSIFGPQILILVSRKLITLTNSPISTAMDDMTLTHDTQINEYILIVGSLFLTNDKSMSFTDLI